jgi:hypothetical protein
MHCKNLKECYHDPIWGVMWIGIDVKECCHDLIWSAMWIGKYVIWSFHDQFEVLNGFDQMVEDDVMT